MGTNERKWWEDAAMALLGVVGCAVALYLMFCV